MKQKYAIELSYNGKNYHGWQIQNNAITVQGVLEEKISTFLREKIEIIGAGRTDTGVHSKFFVADFNSKNFFLDKKEKNFIFKINRFLPNDIAINKIFKVKNNFHSRFDALSRTYKYYIETKKNPFNQETSLIVQKNLNVEKMNEASKILFEYKDFTSFSKVNTDTKTNICKIYKANWVKKNSILIFEIKANRFLRNMVRAIVGTILEVGEEKINISDFRKIIELKNRSKAGVSAAAKALFLTKIEY
ncbi:MAG: tRNA pseudouridine(38-40) synthase TruA [Bacteroidetes bacterium 4572_128]|nr:MAG: tRNA pseudouridine(38-40) synthase TruA [Bacteroidetes bacterium 4572_128]